MILRLTLLAALTLAASSSAMAATASKAKPSLRDQEQAACYDDANRLCKEFIPNEDKIATCMRQKLSQVSKGCRAFFK